MRIQTGQKDEAEALAFLDSLKTRVQAGEAFADLAKKYSNDKDSAPVGGMLGWYEVAKMPTDFHNAVQGLKGGRYRRRLSANSGRISFRWLIIRNIGRWRWTRIGTKSKP